MNALKIIPAVALACGLAACASAALGDIPADGGGNPASIVKLRGDTTHLFLTDYFPALDAADSLSSESLVLVPEDSLWSQFTAIAAPGTGRLSEIRVWKGGRTLSLVGRRMVSDSAEASKPQWVTLAPEAGRLNIGFSARPDRVMALWQNILLPADFVAVGENRAVVTLPSDARDVERSYIRLFAENGAGVYNDILVPLRYGKPVTEPSDVTRHDPQAQVLYSLMIDRFYNGNPDNDRKLALPDVLDRVDYQGGDLAGVTRKIREGFFDSLGVNTIWLSPITQNPTDAWGRNENPKTRFSGYHGYWPIYSTAIDSRFGTDAELRELLDEAHDRGINVILDYVANHLHVDSPVLREHPDWVTPLVLPDGRKNLSLWDECRLTTWFDEHIPTLDLERPEVAGPMTDSALYWIENYDFDGFRHDATKHIPESYWRMLTRKMKTRFPERTLYQIGETYGSVGLIDSYVRSGMLDAQFDFNVYDAATRALAADSGSLADLQRVLLESLDNYGYHNTMGYISGNHDRPRFISLAGGSLSFDEDSKAAGWNRDVTVGDSSSYDKLALLEAFMFTIPGVPCLYQGDEYGVPGGNDPDNRRMMQFGSYADREQRHLETVRRLARLRRGSLPLVFGDYLPLYADRDMLVFARVYQGETAIAALNRADESRTAEFALPMELSADGLVTSFGHASHKVGEGRIMVELPALSFDVMVRDKNESR